MIPFPISLLLTQPILAEATPVPPPLISAADYPRSARRHGREGTSHYQLVIDANGRVTGCTIVESSGHADLDEATCRILTARAIFTPATNAAGNSIESRFTGAITWRLPPKKKSRRR